MSMMNSKFAMKSVLMMGAAAGMMMASGGARAQSSGYTFTAISAPLGTGGTFAPGQSDEIFLQDGLHEKCVTPGSLFPSSAHGDWFL